MKKRKLKYNGQTVTELPKQIDIKINTKCPQKWAFVDMETGDIWVHRSRYKKHKNSAYAFYEADPKALRALDNIMTEVKVKEMGYTENCS